MTSESGKPYANIVRQGAYLVARRLQLRRNKDVLLGLDNYSGGLLSLLGGCFDKNETNPYMVSVREGRDEGGLQLFFILTNAMPQMFYTDAVTGEVLDIAHHHHPANAMYNGHPVVLRFIFEVLEISGHEPTDEDASEISGICWKHLDLSDPAKMRPSTYHGLKTVDWETEPNIRGHLSPDFKSMYKVMHDELNVCPKRAYTWSNHKGTEAIQEGQPFEEMLRLLDKKWQSHIKMHDDDMP